MISYLVQLKSELWTRPVALKDLVLGYQVATELSVVSLECVSKIIKLFIGITGSASLVMSSVLCSDSCTEEFCDSDTVTTHFCPLLSQSP